MFNKVYYFEYIMFFEFHCMKLSFVYKRKILNQKRNEFPFLFLCKKKNITDKKKPINIQRVVVSYQCL